MKVGSEHFRTIWATDDALENRAVEIIDQTKLPFRFEIVKMETVSDAVHAIGDMLVRGAPLIGATAAYGMALAMRNDASDENLQSSYDDLLSSRPTAVNLRWALDNMKNILSPLEPSGRLQAAFARAAEICNEDAAQCSAIGDHGLGLIREIYEKNGRSRPVNILTHCNAGWLATVDWGTATAPIYKAFEAGIPVHVWVDETRPRNQGASLTAWELGQNGVPHTVIVDNAGGHLMQKGEVDMCIVGTDRTTRAGDVCNKIGTYLKALAASDNSVPFYVALPGTTIDWSISDGRDIPIEERSEAEVTEMTGLSKSGELETVRIVANGSPAINPAFDVTPAKFVTALITERGIAAPIEGGLAKLYPEESKY
ncbi:MAG: S-methyl-5-thioribose-1-phosphate isomerase [Rhodospirillaceae bacterium]|nr:S-methyl-5-thioribose-1-phosphate isomerase [Rhodospirillaceae bacterium]